MVAFRENGRCKDAEPYYYDLLSGPDSALVPKAVSEHVRQCSHCQARIQRLQETLAGVEAAPGGGLPDDDARIIETLSSHFEHIGQFVTCTAVKPFIPSLVKPSPRIRIPTPITVHLDHCQRCAADLEALRDLDLEPAQLERLGRIFAHGPVEPSVLCRQAAARMPRIAAGFLEEIEPRILNHVCLCPPCRARLSACRQNRLEGAGPPSQADASTVTCGDIAPSDLFDYVVPYGRVAEPASSTEPATAQHVRACPTCLGRVQNLHEELYGIVERPESQTATVFTASDDGDLAGENVSARYALHGVAVKVVHRSTAPVERPVPAGRNGRAPRPHRLSRRTVKTIATAAAVIAICTLPVAYLSSARALTGEKVNANFRDAPYVHVQKFSGTDEDQRRLTQRYWVLRPEGVLVLHTIATGRSWTEETKTYYDVDNRMRYRIGPDGQLYDETPMTDDEHWDVLAMMNSCLDLSPDDRLLRKELISVPSDSRKGKANDVAEYVLARELPGGHGEAPGVERWRFLVDSAEQPVQVEMAVERPGEPLEPRGTRVFTYLSEWEMREALGAFGAPSLAPTL